MWRTVTKVPLAYRGYHRDIQGLRWRSTISCSSIRRLTSKSRLLKIYHAFIVYPVSLAYRGTHRNSNFYSECFFAYNPFFWQGDLCRGCGGRVSLPGLPKYDAYMSVCRLVFMSRDSMWSGDFMCTGQLST
jgi:hypothetical protein